MEKGKSQIIKGRYNYKQRMEGFFLGTLSSGKPRGTRQVIKTMTNIPHKGTGKLTIDMHGSDFMEIAKQLNSFYCFFESSSTKFTTIVMPPTPSASLEFTIKKSEHLYLL